MSAHASGGARGKPGRAADKRYVGIEHDVHGGMTTIGRIVRDARVFGLIGEEEGCEGWNLAGIDALLQRVDEAWDHHGGLPSRLPPELGARHRRIHGEALARARAAGWSGELETESDS